MLFFSPGSVPGLLAKMADKQIMAMAGRPLLARCPLSTGCWPLAGSLSIVITRLPDSIGLDATVIIRRSGGSPFWNAIGAGRAFNCIMFTLPVDFQSVWTRKRVGDWTGNWPGLWAHPVIRESENVTLPWSVLVCLPCSLAIEPCSINLFDLCSREPPCRQNTEH